MPHPKAPYPAQFRQQMIDLVATGRRPSELAREFGCRETSILSWMRAAKGADGAPSPPATTNASATPSRRLLGPTSNSFFTLRRAKSHIQDTRALAILIYRCIRPVLICPFTVSARRTCSTSYE